MVKKFLVKPLKTSLNPLNLFLLTVFLFSDFLFANEDYARYLFFASKAKSFLFEPSVEKVFTDIIITKDNFKIIHPLRINDPGKLVPGDNIFISRRLIDNSPSSLSTADELVPLQFVGKKADKYTFNNAEGKAIVILKLIVAKNGFTGKNIATPAPFLNRTVKFTHRGKEVLGRAVKILPTGEYIVDIYSGSTTNFNSPVPKLRSNKEITLNEVQLSHVAIGSREIFYSMLDAIHQATGFPRLEEYKKLADKDLELFFQAAKAFMSLLQFKTYSDKKKINVLTEFVNLFMINNHKPALPFAREKVENILCHGIGVCAQKAFIIHELLKLAGFNPKIMRVNYDYNDKLLSSFDSGHRWTEVELVIDGVKKTYIIDPPNSPMEKKSIEGSVNEFNRAFYLNPRASDLQRSHHRKN